MDHLTSRRSFLAQLSAALAAATAGRSLLAADGSKRKPRVLLKSGWQTVNIGDIGHTPGMLRLLARHLPDVDVALWPNSIAGNDTPALFKRHFPDLKIIEKDGVKQAFEDYDFLLHGSGPSLVAATAVAQWRKATMKPWGVIGITLGAQQAKDPAIQETFAAAKFAYFRDTISLGVAKEHLKCPVMEFAPDAAFGVDITDDEKALPFLKEHKLEDGKFLCVIPRLRNSPYWFMKKNEPKDAPTAAEDKAKHKVNEEMKESDHGKVRPAIVEFLRRTDMKVLLCPEDVSHVYVGKEMFLDKLPAEFKDRVVWRDKYWITDEAVSVYKRAFGLLSMDMHSPIMALGNGTPAIVCRFKQQTSKGQMWADIGLPEWLFDLDVEPDGKRITDALMAMAADPGAARAKAAKALAFVHERQKASLGMLATEAKA